MDCFRDDASPFIQIFELSTIDTDLMQAWKVSPDMGSVKNNRPNLVDEVRDSQERLL